MEANTIPIQKPLRVLVACEFSGRVRDAFASLGHDAWSCDLLPSERPNGNHIVADVRTLLDKEGWDLLVAFPPCTHLCSAGAVYWPKKQADGRQRAAIDFVKFLATAPVPHIAIENPVGILSTVWRKPAQYVEPFWFGEPYRKRTGLWLENLPCLIPTHMIEPIAHWHGGSVRGCLKKDGTRTPAKLPTMRKYGERERSRMFEGMAAAMANQWSAFCVSQVAANPAPISQKQAA